MPRPSVVALMSASLDERTALGPGRSQWEEMDDPRSTVSEGIRQAWEIVEKRLIEIHAPDVMMLGSASIQEEAAPLRPLPVPDEAESHPREDHLPTDVIGNPKVRVWLVTVDSKGRLRSGYKGSETPGHHALHLVSQSTPAAYLAFLREQSIPYIVAGQERVDLAAALRRLAGTLGVRRLLAIGGWKAPRGTPSCRPHR